MIINFTSIGSGGGSGSGSTVQWQQSVTAGTQIARITIDGSTQNVYAPEGGSGSSVSYSQTLSAGTEIGQITIDGSATTIYAPAGGSGKKVIDFDALSQQELSDLYTELNALDGAGSGDTINRDYEFYKHYGTIFRSFPMEFVTSNNGLVFGAVISDWTTGSNPPIAYEYILVLNSNGTFSYNGAKHITVEKASASTLGGVKVGSGLAIDANGVLSVSGGTSGGREIVDLDALSQAEKAALFEEISGLTSSGLAVNDKYVFVKNFVSQHSGNQTPYAVEYTKYESSKMWFLGFNWGGQSGEIWVLKYALKADGTDEVAMAPNYSFAGLSRDSIFRSREWAKYDYTTSAFTTSNASDTMFTGDTCSGAWATDFNTNTFNQTRTPEYKFKVTDETFNERLFTNPVVSYETLASPVTLEDAQGTSRQFPYIWFLDYGYCIVSMYVDLDQQRYARLSIERRKNVVSISQADYDALVLAGTVDANTVYVII